MEEIKAGDIMIGNYIRDIWSENGFFKVTELRKDKVFYGNCFKAKYEDVRPIRLTEDILINAGFKIDSNKNYWLPLDLDKYIDLIPSEGFYYPQIVQDPEMSMQDESVVSLNRISSLHELQNLFKILTGNDLKIQV